MNETEHFKEYEFRCTCCGANEMKDSFLEKLQLIRYDFGKPMRISSGFRCAAYNDSISSTGPFGPHTTGRAADILISGEDMYELLRLAFRHNMTGIGIKGHGSMASRFLHLDDLLASKSRLRPTIWSY